MKIEKLEIRAGNLEDQLRFYRDIFGLEVGNRTTTSFEVKMGYSVLKFVAGNFTPYHIALHIPPHEEEFALAWLKARLTVQKNGYEEIIDFSAWNARSLYFYDADLNIMEFISRNNLFTERSGGFSEKSILGIAEIGLATHSIPEKFKFLEDRCNLEKFDGNFDNFCAIGDDEGLIITIDKNKKEWFPTNDKAFSSEFKLRFSHKGNNYNLLYIKDELHFLEKDR
ncbi:hypothetical protein BH23BAC2_BH23BAC2_00980 [soil metagenome]